MVAPIPACRRPRLRSSLRRHRHLRCRPSAARAAWPRPSSSVLRRITVMSSRLVLLIAASAALGACTTNIANKHIGEEDSGFGEAAKYDAAVQIINPVPVYGEDGAQPGGNGDKGAAAVKRYRTDQVKQVQTMQTTTSGGSGSGGTPH